MSGFSREDKLIPILTTVIYWGNEPWNGPRCLKNNESQFSDLSKDTYNIIGVYSNSRRLLERREEFQTETGGINMCKALEQIEDRGVKRGIEQGRQKERELCIQGIIRICKNLDFSMENTINQIMSIYPQPTEQLEGYIKKYWV